MTISAIVNKQPQVKTYKPADEKYKVKDVHQVKVASNEDVSIKLEIDRLQQWENHVKQHELNHALVGGSNVSSISYVYTYGPDGKKYISGGQVNVHIPKGVSKDSVKTIEKLKKATGASKDMSLKDSMNAGMLSAIEHSRASKLRMIEAIKKYETQKQSTEIEDIKSGDEIFVYKKLDNSGVHLLELFV